MARAIKIAIALLCLTCVLALCIAPWVDPPQTTLKALQTILFLMSALAVLAFWFAELLSPERQNLHEPVWLKALPFPNLLLPREAGCVQRC
jgi:hypothetical protein